MSRRLRRVIGHGVRAPSRVLSSAIDRCLNVDTTDNVHLASLGLDNQFRVDYQPAYWTVLRRAFRAREVSPDDVFLDLGSGKGRIVLLAARYRFKRVIGVELSQELTAIARRNVSAYRLPMRCGGVELVNADVMDYVIPDDVTVLFLYNPFRGPILDVVIENLIASVDRRPRTMRLIYLNASEHARLIATGRFRLVHVSAPLRLTRGWRESATVGVYVLEPEPPERRPVELATRRRRTGWISDRRSGPPV